MPNIPPLASERGAKRLIRLSQAVVDWPVSKNTLRRKIASGELPAYRLGTRILAVDVSDLEALFKPVPTADPATWGDVA